MDYEKLKFAHEALKQYSEKMEIPTNLNMSYNLTSGDWCYDLQWEDKDLHFCDIDELNEKLKEYRVIKPKYQKGQKVYILSPVNHGEIEIVTVLSCAHDMEDGYFYQFYQKYDSWYEDSVYESYREAIQSQIDHWTKLLLESVAHEDLEGVIEFPKAHMHIWGVNDPNKICSICGESQACKHEPSDSTYLCNPPKRKCIKCGEFYV